MHEKKNIVDIKNSGKTDISSKDLYKFIRNKANEINHKKDKGDK